MSEALQATARHVSSALDVDVESSIPFDFPQFSSCDRPLWRLLPTHVDPDESAWRMTPLQAHEAQIRNTDPLRAFRSTAGETCVCLFFFPPRPSELLGGCLIVSAFKNVVRT